MAIIWRMDDPPFYGDAPGDCFLCWGELTFPVIVWQGASGLLSLHPDCLMPLFEKLIVDRYALRQAEVLP